MLHRKFGSKQTSNQKLWFLLSLFLSLNDLIEFLSFRQTDSYTGNKNNIRFCLNFQTKWEKKTLSYSNENAIPTAIFSGNNTWCTRWTKRSETEFYLYHFIYICIALSLSLSLARHRLLAKWKCIYLNENIFFAVLYFICASFFWKLKNINRERQKEKKRIVYFGWVFILSDLAQNT